MEGVVIACFVVLIIFLFVCFFFIFKDEANRQDGKQKIKDTESVLTNAKTIGNHTYVRINIAVYPGEDFFEEILKIVDAFEKKNSHLKITAWRLQGHFDTVYVTDRVSSIHGIWIDHEPA